ncbi:hypothetical protein Tco_0504553 [Tanacetum coccineum]
MTTLAEFMIIAGEDNRPPMLEKSLYDSWKSHMEHYMENMENGRMILNSVQNGSLIWPTVTDEDGLPPDVYAIFNHHKVAKEIWDRVKLLMQGTKLSLQEKDCNLYDEFDKFTFVKGETLSCCPIAYLNKARDFLKVVASLRFPSTNNQLRTFSLNTRNQATIQDGKGEIIQGGRLGWLSVIIVKVNVTWLGNVLNQRDLGMLHDPGILDGQAVQTTIPNNDAFQTEDLDAYDSDCDDVSIAKAVLMANLSSYGSDDFKQTPVVDFSNNEIHSDSNIILYSQYLQETQLGVEKANQEKNNESLTAELERYKERVKTFEQHLNIDLSTREKMIDSQMDDMIKEKLALKQQIDSLEQNLSN